MHPTVRAAFASKVLASCCSRTRRVHVAAPAPALKSECGRESVVGSAHLIITLILIVQVSHSFILIISPSSPKSHGERQAVTGAGRGCSWRLPAANLHVWRSRQDGRSVVDPEQRPCSYPTWTTRQPFSGRALPSPIRRGGDKRTPRKSLFQLICPPTAAG